MRETASKAFWLGIAALGLGIAYAIYRGQKKANSRQIVGCAIDCVDCAEGNVLSCLNCGTCAAYL